MEMIVVVLLLSIFLVVSVPSFRHAVLPDALRSDTRKLIAIINDVRQQAKISQAAQIIQIDLDDGRVWYGSDADAVSDSEREIDVKFILSDEVRIRDVVYDSGKVIDRGIAELWVSNRGYMERSVLHLENASNEEISLLVETFIPDLRVLDGYVGLE